MAHINWSITAGVLDWCLALLKTALLLLLFQFARFAGLTWRHYLSGIAIGLGVYTTVDVVGISVQTHSGLLSAATYALVKSAAFNCGVMVWMSCFLIHSSVAPAIGTVPNDEIKTWDSTFDVLLRRE